MLQEEEELRFIEDLNSTLMLDTEKHTTTNVAAAETNVWDAVLSLYKARYDLVTRITSVSDTEIRKECQEQIDDIDHRVEYLTEL